MEVFEAVRTLLAVRSFDDRPVPEEIVREIVEAAHLTASSMNKQPWHFIVVQDRALLERIGSVETTGPYVASAAFAIAVAIDRTKFAVSDASRAAQSMMLTAWSRGVGSNWIGFMGPAAVKPLLGIPDEVDLLAVVAFGYPAEEIGQGKKKRKPLGEIASRGRWGEPFS